MLVQVSEAGSVVVEKLMEVERYSHVMHISSTVTGRLLPDLDAWDALRAALPAGTVSGAPKVRGPTKFPLKTLLCGQDMAACKSSELLSATLLSESAVMRAVYGRCGPCRVWMSSRRQREGLLAAVSTMHHSRGAWTWQWRSAQCPVHSF